MNAQTLQENSPEQLKKRIEELERENRKWIKLAGTNRLTGLPNSLMLLQVVLPAELGKCDESGISISCALIAPDHLGVVNENYGRAVGDRLIVEFGALLKKKVGEGERLFHMDGANFALLVLDAPEGRGRRRATDMRTAVSDATFRVGEREFKEITCSAGVASIEGVVRKDEISERVTALYEEMADRLFKAKQRGGNHVMGSGRNL